MEDISVPIGLAARVESEYHDEGYEWVLDDRSGPGSLGGFYLCSLSRDGSDWWGSSSWQATLADLTRVVQDITTWLTPAESAPLVASIPIESARLERLSDEARLDELFALQSLEQIAETWVRIHTSSARDQASAGQWWAIEAMMSPWLRGSEPLYRSALQHLVRAADGNDLAMCNVGAGPLEDFICDDESRLAWIEEQAAGSAAFREALANVWIWELPEAVFQRVERAAGVPLDRPTW